MKSGKSNFIYLVLACFLIFGGKTYPQDDSIAGIYRGAPKTASGNLKKHLLNLYSNKECVYDSNLPGEYHKRGKWYLNSDTVTCKFDIAVIHKHVNGSKVLGVAEKKLNPPQIHKYLITKKNNLTKLPSGVHFIKDPPVKHWYPPSNVGVIDGAYTTESGVKKQKQADSLAQIKISIYQAKTIQDSIKKLFIGTWKTGVAFLPCLDCYESPGERKKRIKNHEKKFGYMIYTFNEDGTFLQEFIHPKRKSENWGLIGAWSIASKFVPKDWAWSQSLRKYRCCWENQVNFSDMQPYQEPEKLENHKNYETGTAHLYLKDHRFEIHRIDQWSFSVSDTLSIHGAHFEKIK